MIDVSIIVMSYNYDRYVSKAIQSACEQQGAYSMEIIIVDDGSSDNSVTQIKAIQDPRIKRVFHKKNLGALQTFEDGLKISSGEFVCRLDADDVLMPHFLDYSVKALRENPGTSFSYANAMMINAEGNISEQTPILHPQPGVRRDDFYSLLIRNYICAPTVLMRASIVKQIVPVPRELPFIDWYCYLMVSRYRDTFYINQSLAYYRVHDTNMHTRISADKSEETSILWLLEQFFNKHIDSPEISKRQRKLILVSHYRDFADKYFGHGMYSDARRCYWMAIRFLSSRALAGGGLRRFIATLISPRLYNTVKKLLA